MPSRCAFVPDAHIATSTADCNCTFTVTQKLQGLNICLRRIIQVVWRKTSLAHRSVTRSHVDEKEEVKGHTWRKNNNSITTIWQVNRPRNTWDRTLGEECNFAKKSRERLELISHIHYAVLRGNHVYLPTIIIFLFILGFTLTDYIWLTLLRHFLPLIASTQLLFLCACYPLINHEAYFVCRRQVLAQYLKTFLSI